MSKSRDAFRTISEVAEWLDTPAHVLRFWESKFTQVKPVKRAGGRRYYRPADMQLLAGLKQLLHEDGLTIKGAQKIMRERGVKYVASLSTHSVDDDGDGSATTASTADTPVEEAPFIDVPSEDVAPLEDPSTVVPFSPAADDDGSAQHVAPDEDTGVDVAPDSDASAPIEPTADIAAPVDDGTQSDPVDDAPKMAVQESAPAIEPAAQSGMVQGSLLDLLGIPDTPAPVPEPAPLAEHSDTAAASIEDEIATEQAAELETAQESSASDGVEDLGDDISPEDTPQHVDQVEQDLPPEPDLTTAAPVAGPLSMIAKLPDSARNSVEVAQLLPKLAHLAGLSTDTHID